MKLFQQTYFTNKNYVSIYIHNFFDTFGKSLLDLFSGILLYQLGVPIQYIFLFFALNFGLMGFLTPLSIMLSSKLGIIQTIFLSSFFYVIGSSLLVFGSYENIILLFSSLIFFSLKGALYHPLIDGVISMYIEDSHKGRFNSLNNIFKILGIFLSITIGSFLLIQGNTIAVIGVIIMTLLISLLSYIFLLDKRDINYSYSFTAVYTYLVSNKFRENIIPFSVQTFLIMERILLPLFIFILVGDLKLTAIIVVFSIFVEILLLFLFGKHIDRFSRKSFFEASFVKSINPLIFITSYFSTYVLYLGQIYHRISDNLFETSFATAYQKKAKKIEDPILFTTCKEMTLCFSELLFLTILCLLAIVLQEKIFILLFLGSFLSTWILYLNWRD